MGIDSGRLSRLAGAVYGYGHIPAGHRNDAVPLLQYSPPAHDVHQEAPMSRAFDGGRIPNDPDSAPQ